MLDQLIIILRAAQLHAHNAHNLVQGPTFFEDHEMLGELYPKYESAYDSIVERMIGLGKTPNLIDTQDGAVQVIKRLPASTDAREIFHTVLQLEELVCKKAQECAMSSEYSEGTRQLLGNICDDSEGRQYKIKQRIKY
jgi:DNA-binding ferritin-like protein